MMLLRFFALLYLASSAFAIHLIPGHIYVSASESHGNKFVIFIGPAGTRHPGEVVITPLNPRLLPDNFKKPADNHFGKDNALFKGQTITESLFYIVHPDDLSLPTEPYQQAVLDEPTLKQYQRHLTDMFWEPGHNARKRR